MSHSNDNTSAITNCTTHLVINVSDEQPSVPNKKLPDVAVLDDPDGWLNDEHISQLTHKSPQKPTRFAL